MLTGPEERLQTACFCCARHDDRIANPFPPLANSDFLGLVNLTSAEAKVGKKGTSREKGDRKGGIVSPDHPSGVQVTLFGIDSKCHNDHPWPSCHLAQ
jgi:hypothetical protein